MNDLDRYNFSTKDGFNSVLLKLSYQEFVPYFKGDSCLELGCADGEGTKILLKHFKRVVAVDGSRKLIEKAREGIRTKKVRFAYSLFEKLQLTERFDTIVLAHVLEHINEPVEALKRVKKFAERGSVGIIVVPNAYSVHRQIGVLMGLIKNEHSLDESDKSVGHKRVYDQASLERDIKRAGLKIKKSGGLFLKPFSNAQMEKILKEKIFTRRGVHALKEIGKKYPEIAAEIYLICTL